MTRMGPAFLPPSGKDVTLLLYSLRDASTERLARKHPEIFSAQSANVMESHLSDSPKPFRLLDLPAELRIRIYEHALTAPNKAIQIYYSFQRDRISPGLVLPLLRTCRQIQVETQDTLFLENTIFAPANTRRRATRAASVLTFEEPLSQKFLKTLF
ncbi:hypothetical protein SLS56_006212 [Neofusicoccum ribis]|uniref:F-box domain-containing protein n=1 Tax=Neofusicoccum ribis TaxID=45134 RepID=A0ABR3SS92_9PEZI